jgi:mRNA interferase MazF
MGLLYFISPVLAAILCGTVIAIAITSQEPRAGFPLTLELNSQKLPKQSWAKISQIRTLSVKRLGSKLGRVSPEELSQIVEGLSEIIGGQFDRWGPVFFR